MIRDSSYEQLDSLALFTAFDHMVTPARPIWTCARRLSPGTNAWLTRKALCRTRRSNPKKATLTSSGCHATLLHRVAGSRKLRKVDPTDVETQSRGFSADETRQDNVIRRGTSFPL